MTPSTLALARRVRALLEAPERWTQGHMAETAKGSACRSESRHAARWCLLGAVTRSWAELDSDWQDEDELSIALRAYTGPDGLIHWNDAPGRTHADVLALLDTVIAEGER